ncbi:MAG: beta-lactamase family protein [Chloroflexi bacterium]|nr:beta-lactamase family protein [Acidobacteriota bacterium]MCA1587947.1 beta-lactamase family protein [Chloroflexota bacterium]MCA1719574.1 beta-lactamase family protein [Actinomycetota bacterium]
MTWWDDVVEQVQAVHDEDPANLPGAAFAAETTVDGPMAASVGAWPVDTICAIGTMTKAFTGTAVLLALEERGMLDVEIPVWRLPGMEIYTRTELTKQIRVRHLLQHTAGLPTIQHYTVSPKTRCNDPDGPPPYCPEARIELGPTGEYTCYPGGANEYMFVDGRCQPARMLTIDQVSRYIMETYDPLTTPGGEYLYSTIGYVVAARIVEQLSGQSINRFLAERLFAPLRMTDSFFVAQPTGDRVLDALIDDHVSADQRTRIADVTVITKDGEMPPEVTPGPDGRWDKYRRGWRFVFPDGGMYTTVIDLLTFLRTLRDGGCGVLSAEVVRLLVEDNGFGHTMGFGLRRQATPYGQGAGTCEQLGGMMTYCWLDRHAEVPLIGAFFSQRLPNIVVNPNMGSGMKVIFRVFVPAVSNAVNKVPR